jgi:hypothetical protein
MARKQRRQTTKRTKGKTAAKRSTGRKKTSGGKRGKKGLSWLGL